MVAVSLAPQPKVAARCRHAAAAVSTSMAPRLIDGRCRGCGGQQPPEVRGVPRAPAGAAAVVAAGAFDACVPTQELPRPRSSKNSVLEFPTVLHAVPRGWC